MLNKMVLIFLSGASESCRLVTGEVGVYLFFLSCSTEADASRTEGLRADFHFQLRAFADYKTYGGFDAAYHDPRSVH